MSYIDDVVPIATVVPLWQSAKQDAKRAHGYIKILAHAYVTFSWRMVISFAPEKAGNDEIG